MAGQADVFILLILAFVFPPAAVAFVAGCGADFCLNVLLTILGYLPGLIHACWLVLRRAEANERYGHRNWTYSGMGEYTPIRPGSGQHPPSYGPVPPEPPPPPPGQHPADQAPPPPSQAPVDQKSSGYAPPPAPPEQKYGGYQAPPQAPTDQKAVDVFPATSTDQKPADSSAPPGGT